MSPWWPVGLGRPGLLSCDAFLFSGTGGCREGESAFGSGGVPGSGIFPGADSQHYAVIERPAPGIALAAGMAGGAEVVDAGAAQGGEGDRVAVGFGQEVAAVAEGMRPPVES